MTDKKWTAAELQVAALDFAGLYREFCERTTPDVVASEYPGFITPGTGQNGPIDLAKYPHWKPLADWVARGDRTIIISRLPDPLRDRLRRWWNRVVLRKPAVSWWGTGK